MPVARDGKEAERRRLAEALRANLRRRKAVEKSAPEGASRQTRDTPAAGLGQDGERG